MTVRRVLVGSVIAVAIAGCFAEADGDTAGAATDTGAVECPIGGNGCPCTEGGGCDQDLACHTPSGLCFDETCSPGAAACTCLDGGCVNGLECRDELCQPPLPAGTNGTSGGGGDATSEPGSSSSMPDATTTAPPPETSSESGSDDGALPTCGECFMTTGMRMCPTQWMMCMTDPAGQTGCPDALACGPEPICCPMKSERSSITLFDDLLECVGSVCVPSCSEILQCGA